MKTLTFDPDMTLELGIFAKTFGRSSIDEVFDAIAGHGLSCAQWNWACVPGLSSLPEIVPRETTRAVAHAAARSNVRIVAVSTTFNLLQSATRDRALAQLPALAEAALSIGCDLLTLCTGTRHPTDMWAYHPDNQSPQAWAEMIDGLRAACRVASRCGVRLAIEPETANVVADAPKAQRALDELGSDGEPLSIILDAANLYRPPMDPRLHGGIIDDALARLGPSMSLAHAKDIADPGGSGGGTRHRCGRTLHARGGGYRHPAVRALPRRSTGCGATLRGNQRWSRPAGHLARSERSAGSSVRGVPASVDRGTSRDHLTMPFYQSGDLHLHYVCRGAPLRQTSTAIVFQHGIGGDVRQPTRFLVPERTSIPAEELSIVHTDFRGHGQSDLGHIERLSIETLANDLVALLDHLKLEQAIVGGISMGAAAALRLAVQQPERCQALILCRPAWADGPMSAVARHSLGLVAELLAADDWQQSAAPSLEQSEILHSVEHICPDAAKSLRGQVRPSWRAPRAARRQ